MRSDRNGGSQRSYTIDFVPRTASFAYDRASFTRRAHNRALRRWRKCGLDRRRQQVKHMRAEPETGTARVRSELYLFSRALTRVMSR